MNLPALLTTTALSLAALAALATVWTPLLAVLCWSLAAVAFLTFVAAEGDR